MKTNDAGKKIIIEFEGFEKVSYPDPDSLLGREMLKTPNKRMPNWMCLPGDPWTIGIGATGKGVGPGVTWTEEQILLRFAQDLEGFEKQVVKALQTSANENQFSALVCFVFNMGIVKFRGSTLLRKFNEGDTLGAAAEFPHWDHGSSGEELAGLRRRRLAEQQLFLTPVLRTVA